MTASDDLSTLQSRMADAELRIAALEQEHADSPRTAAADVARTDDLWAVTELRRRAPSPGAVMLVGDVTTPSGAQALWQEGRTTTELLDADWAARAAALAALAHPVRLQIMRLALDGTVSARDLAGRDDLGSTGQVYHHLRHLTGAGWLVAQSGQHSVPVDRIVPFLAIMVGASR